MVRREERGGVKGRAVRGPSGRSDGHPARQPLRVRRFPVDAGLRRAPNGSPAGPGEAPARDPPDQGADHLDGRHQGESEQHGPQQAIAELGAGLAVGGNAAGIVVGCAGDKARSKGSPHAAEAAHRSNTSDSTALRL